MGASVMTLGTMGTRRADHAFMARANGPITVDPPGPHWVCTYWLSIRTYMVLSNSLNRSLECSDCPFLFHRVRLGLFHWLGLKCFERDDFLSPRSQLRVMLFRIFPRKPIDRGQPVRFRCCSDFRPRRDRFPC